MAQAETVTTPSPFIAKLLVPVPAPADAKAAREYERELRQEMEAAWAYVRHRYYAADAYRSYCSHALSAAVIQHRRIDLPEWRADQNAFQTFVAAVDALMLVPAPTIGALRLKQKLAGVDGGRPNWDKAISSDKEKHRAKTKSVR